MDPNDNLDEQRQLKLELDQLDRASGPEAGRQLTRIPLLERLAELAEALDQWLSDGGFLPSAWSHR